MGPTTKAIEDTSDEVVLHALERAAAVLKQFPDITPSDAAQCAIAAMLLDHDRYLGR